MSGVKPWRPTSQTPNPEIKLSYLIKTYGMDLRSAFDE